VTVFEDETRRNGKKRLKLGTRFYVRSSSGRGSYGGYDELRGDSEGGGRLRQEAELLPEGDWRDCDFFLSPLAFYGFQSITRVEEYEWIWCFVWYIDKGEEPKHANHGVCGSVLGLTYEYQGLAEHTEVSIKHLQHYPHSKLQQI
jgi:hypothetical protein